MPTARGEASPEPGGRFTAAASRQALAAICAVAGLDDTDAVALKLTVNSVYRLPRAAAVVRIATSPAMTHRIPKVIRVARWLEAAGVPAVRLFPGVPAPVTAGGARATVWVDETARADEGTLASTAPRAADLGAALRRLHALEPPRPALPDWDPLDDARRRISDAEGLPAADRDFLEELLDRVATDLRAVRYRLPTAVVHGDAHLGNLIRAPDGRVLLCDFDSVSVGPAEWDLVPVAVGALRFGHPPSRHAELAAAYGVDVTRWDGFGALRAVRELKLVTSVLPILASSPTVAAQFRVRLASLRAGDQTIRWAPYR
ncbi:aminoglycoside phosphotransferase family protein [Frankia sp. CNm7]|uniref:Aminoglycoside phosphotransferase family protein n=1 Tax=Frankia nepalensis TaxID=1836974 RepID=A0A937URG5_9ACTN|nr:aminoglycoside phosphotransferase family protein [Frankia nepalensis]MBL7502095.1 aminoglycoside phosphotransferase family protein [Frankia nepalensis]MBL7512672.1 aminoglycoside phosphotransferase family protein [Frankia nepalensis]MBL7521993.1 aminoglycoside phosphotransferase family protein [Frankia nepalensis]MBL7631337.1 aminoglycoside phosphotransferase family protein [Frankia nepalensis]